MVDGLGLAETTPGPLILVTEFVGYMAGFRASGLQGSANAGVGGTRCFNFLRRKTTGNLT